MPRGISAIGRLSSIPFQRLTTVLRRRRATLSDADRSSWIEVSPFKSKEQASNEPQQFNRGDIASVSSHNSLAHRASLSMSSLYQRNSWLAGHSQELTCITDANCSDVDLGDMSICSYFSMAPSEPDLTVDISTGSHHHNQSSHGEDEIISQHGQVEEQTSANWDLIINAPIESTSIVSMDMNISLVSSRSLANVMGLTEEREQSDKVDHSTPIRRRDTLTCQSTIELARKSLCSEMGFTAPSSLAQDSPCRTSSDLSSLRQRRMTIDTNTDSFLSSGVDEELVISPDVSPERNECSEREIIVVEMDESISQQQLVDTEMMNVEMEPVDEQRETYFTYSTHRHHQEVGGNYLDPVEEVTEEPTIPISERDDWTEEHSSLQGTQEEWAKLHGLATPSSLAVSPCSQSRFGWAEVIETGRRASQQSVVQQRSRQSLQSVTTRFSPRTKSRFDSDLSAHTRAYLASTWGTPSRLIGLHSQFWVNSPPSLALDAQALLQGYSKRKRNTRGGLMLAMSPSSTLGEESSWVDGALAEDEERKAQQEVDRYEKKWKRKSRSWQGMENIAGQESPQGAARAKGAKHRSSASLQSLLEVAVKRTLVLRQRSRASASDSNRSSLASSMTLNSVSATVKSDGRASWGNESNIKIEGSTPPPPRTPPQQHTKSGSSNSSIETSARAPTKSASSRRSILSHQSNVEAESPSRNTRSSRQGSMSPMSRLPKKGGSMSRKSPAVGGRADYIVHSRKESRVREKVKMLEYTLQAGLEQQIRMHHQQQHQQQQELTKKASLSPRKKVQPRKSFTCFLSALFSLLISAFVQVSLYREVLANSA